MRLILAMTLLVAPAYASTYDIAASVMQEVNQSHRYVYYAAKDFDPMGKGERGNCARFAATFAKAMSEHGIETHPLILKNGEGVGHAVALTSDGWVLDVQARQPVRVEKYLDGR